MNYKVEFTRHWDERGSATIEAENEDEAKEIGLELLADNSDDIKWSDMDPQGDEVESVEALE